MAATARARFEGAHSVLAEALRPVLLKNGRDFIQYGEQAVSAAKLEKKHINNGHFFLQKIKPLQSNLSFSKTLWRKAIRETVEKLSDQPGCLVKEQHMDNYVESMTKRSMNMCRVVAQGEKKNQSADWVRSLPWNGGDSGDGAQPKSGPTAAAKTPGLFIYGWSAELNAAWRCDMSQKTMGPKEYSIRIDIPENPQATDAVVAHWIDGGSWQVSDVTVAEFLCARGSATPADEIWAGQHVISKAQLALKNRPDRQALLSLYEQSKQILQIAYSLFASQPDCIDFMRAICCDYAEDKIPKEELYSERNRRFAEQFPQAISKYQKNESFVLSFVFF